MKCTRRTVKTARFRGCEGACMDAFDITILALIEALVVALVVAVVRDIQETLI